MLQIEEISKKFIHSRREIKLFSGFSLKLLRKDFIAVCGPSGCGKTTLMLMTGGLLAPDSGRVFLHGRDIYTLSSEERALFRSENIGFVFQQFHLLPYLTVLDNILLPALAAKLPGSRKRALSLAEELRLTERLSHLPSELSIGERQRTALARALLNNPTLILADEPTGNLDTENADIVIGMLRKTAENGSAVMMVTHSREAAEKADRIIKLP